MIYKFNALVPGTVWVGGFNFRHGVSPNELAAFRSAFTYASEGVTEDGGLIIRMGAATAKGYGLCAVYLHGQLGEGINAWKYHDNKQLCPVPSEGEGMDQQLLDYIKHIQSMQGDTAEAMAKVLK